MIPALPNSYNGPDLHGDALLRHKAALTQYKDLSTSGSLIFMDRGRDLCVNIRFSNRISVYPPPLDMWFALRDAELYVGLSGYPDPAPNRKNESERDFMSRIEDSRYFLIETQKLPPKPLSPAEPLYRRLREIPEGTTLEKVMGMLEGKD